MAGPWRGWNAEIKISGLTVAWADSASVDVDSDVVGHFVIGGRLVKDFTIGNLDVTGTISRVWFKTGLIEMLTDDTKFEKFDLEFWAEGGDSSTAPYVKVTGCVPTTGALDIPQDAVLTEDIDWQGTSVSFSGGSGLVAT